MKEYEYVGILLTVFAYTMLVTGNLYLGFVVGLLGNICLIAYFAWIKSLPTAWLQAFFVCANCYGIVSL
jgi:hypothetical protein